MRAAGSRRVRRSTHISAAASLATNRNRRGIGGADGQSILDLVTRIVRGDYGSVTSLLIVRHGQLVVEEYFGWSSSRAHTLQSVTKSVTSLLTGVAVDNRKVAVTDRAVSFFPDY